MADGLCVALTGGTGFVGRHVLDHLLDAGHTVRALVRDPNKLDRRDARLTAVEGDLFRPDSLRELCDGAEAVIHLVGIIMEKPDRGQTFDRVHVEGTKNLLDAARSAGTVERWVQMSALGSRPHATSDYHRTKWDAEQAVREAGFKWTIFRPSIIHGPDGEFTQMVKGFWCNAFPPGFVPYFAGGAFGGKGAGRLQPVFVDDVARCFVDALTNPHSVGEVYPLGGPEAMTWRQMYEITREHLSCARSKRIVGVPVWYANLIAGLPGVPFNRDQVVMSQEDSVCQPAKAQSHFEFEFAPFEEKFAEYAPQIG